MIFNINSTRGHTGSLLVYITIIATQNENVTLRNLGVWWPSGLEHGSGDRVVLGSSPAGDTSLGNFGNSVYPALPVCLRGETIKAASPVWCLYKDKKNITHWVLEKDNSKIKLKTMSPNSIGR